VLLRGPSGCGKSDLALRILSVFGGQAGKAALVADDQVRLRNVRGVLRASAPASIAGRMEVRGVGIVKVPHRAQAQLRLIVDLVAGRGVKRLPPRPPATEVLQGVAVPCYRLAAFEASAPAKVKLLLTGRP
jgi:serine kinase of HPr protein (carbohydrate metabolism regulator)